MIRFSKKAAALSAAAVLLITGCVPSQKFLSKQGRSITERETSYIRVLVLKSTKPITITSENGVRISNVQTRVIEHETDLKRAVFAPDRVKSPLIVESTTGSLTINNTQYRGMIEVRSALGTLIAINIVKMEDYLSSVVPSEVSTSWDSEALKAQAVAARTYAYYNILHKNTELFDLDATTNFQVYKGVTSENEHTTEAVKTTSGEIMTYENQPIVAFFHSTCGGTTADNTTVWNGESLPYLVGRTCPYCKASPYYRWEENIPISEISSYIAERYEGIGKIKGLSFNRKNGRVVEAVVRHDGGMMKISGNDFRMAMPEKRLKSMYFESKKIGKSIEFEGKGWGHGVGMCQYGSKGMAEKGKSYKDILSYYFKNIEFNKINNGR
jgi:stage II sporulation protein D